MMRFMISATEFIDKMPDEETWNSMSGEERLAHLQEFENLMAEQTHRPAVEIRIVPVYKRGIRGLQGYFSQGDNAIYIHPRYLEKSRLSRFSGLSFYTYGNALDLIAHEGRHVWQRYVVDHPELELVDKKDRISMLLNFENYIGGDDRYGAQLLERDARRFAREVISLLLEQCKAKTGIEDARLVDAIEQSKENEHAWAEALLKSGYTVEDLREYEEKARERMETVYPGMDFSEATIFDGVPEFMESENYEEYIDGFRIIGCNIEEQEIEKSDICKPKIEKQIGFQEGTDRARRVSIGYKGFN